MMNNQIMDKFQRCIRDNRCKQDFETICEIGHGGFSTVYKVKNIIDDNFYSLKKLTLYIKSIKNNFSEEVEKVLREAKFLASLDHPNIIRYFNAWLEVKHLSDNAGKGIKTKRLPLENVKQAQFLEINNNNEDEDIMFEPCFLECENDEDEFELQIDFDDDEENSELPNMQKSSSLNIQDLKNQQEEDKASPTFNNESTNYNHNLNKILAQPKPLKHSDKIDYASCYSRNDPFGTFKKALEKSKTPEPISCPFSPQSPSWNLQQLKSIQLFIQTELCTQTLESYLQKRNLELATLKQFQNARYQEVWRSYMKEAIKFAIQLVQALKYIHQNCKLVHRDIKPSNIFLTEDKILKVGDFGLVKKLEEFQSPQREFSFNCIQLSKMTPLSSGSTVSTTEQNPQALNSNQNSRPCGTLTYAAPEQIDTTKICQSFDQRADIYSLAFVFIQLFYPMKTQMELQKVLDEARKLESGPIELNNEVNEIANLVKRMLSANPKKRPNLNEILLTIKIQEEKLNASNAFNCQIQVNFENQDGWIDKCLKIINGNLYFFRSLSEPKAETLYNLCESKIELIVPEQDPKSENISSLSKKNSNSCICNLLSIENFLNKKDLSLESSYSILIQHPIQLSCIIQGKSQKQTEQIYQEIISIYEKLNND